MNDSALGLIFDISANPAKATAAMKELGTVATQQAQVIASANNTIRASVQQGTEQSMAGIRELQERMAALLADVQDETEDYTMQLGSMDTLMTAAFSVTAVMGLLAILPQLGAAFDKVTTALTGWDEKAKQAYDSFLDRNQKAVDAVIELQMRINTALGEPQSANIAVLDRELEKIQQRMVVLNTELATTPTITRKDPKTGVDQVIPTPRDRSTSEVQAEIDRAQKRLDEFKDQRDALLADSVVQGHQLAHQLFKDIVKRDDERTEKAIANARKRAEEEARWTNEAHNAQVRFDLQYQEFEKKVTEERKDLKKSLEDLEKAGRDQLFKNAQQREAESDEILRDANAKRAELMVKHLQMRLAAQRDEQDDTFKLEETGAENQLRLRQITGQQFLNIQRDIARRRFQAHRDDLNRQLAAAKAAYGAESLEYQKLVYAKEALDRQYAQTKAGFTNEGIISNRMFAESTLNSLTAIAGAIAKNSDFERAAILARAALMAGISIADSIRSFAMGNWKAGTLHALAAAEYAAVGASQAGIGSHGGGGGGGYGGGGGGQQQQGYFAPPALAQGSRGGGTVRVMVYGTNNELAQEIASLLTNAVRHQGVQLLASNGVYGRGRP